MFGKIVTLLFLYFFAAQAFPYENITCHSSLLSTYLTGEGLTLGSHNKSGDFVHRIGDQYVVLNSNPDTIVYPSSDNSYSVWDICNCGIRNSANSFFLKSTNGSDIFFTGYMYLEKPFAGLVPVPQLNDVFAISIPTPYCLKCVLTANLETKTVELKPFSDDDGERQRQYWVRKEVNKQ